MREGDVRMNVLLQEAISPVRNEPKGTIKLVATVLVVDDEPIVREVVVRYLEREGYATLEADDGERPRARCSRPKRRISSCST